MSNRAFPEVQAEPARPRRIKLTIWMIIFQILAVLILAPWLGSVAFASMIGWPDVVEGDWDFTAIVFSALVLYPLLAAIPVAVAWILYVKYRDGRAAIVITLPVLMFILGVVLWM